MDDRSLNLVATLGTMLGDTVARAVEASTGMSGAAPAGLAALLAEPGLSVDALARTLGITGSGGVRLIDRLAGAGLVVRGPGKDARQVSLRLTAAGEELARRVLRARGEAVEHALAALDESEQAVLVLLAEKMLISATTGREQADRLCRLCDTKACPTDRCPVEQAVP